MVINVPLDQMVRDPHFTSALPDVILDRLYL